MVAVATAPPSRLAATGVPVRADTPARAAGPMPSRPAATWVREAPMVQVSPLAISTQMNAAATTDQQADGVQPAKLASRSEPPPRHTLTIHGARLSKRARAAHEHRMLR